MLKETVALQFFPRTFQSAKALKIQPASLDTAIALLATPQNTPRRKPKAHKLLLNVHEQPTRRKSEQVLTTVGSRVMPLAVNVYNLPGSV